METGRPVHRTVFGDGPATGRAARKERKRLRELSRLQAATKRKKASGPGLPGPAYGEGGSTAPAQGWGLRRLKVQGVPTTAHLAATTMSWVAGPSLGSDGVLVGDDLNGGGAFCIDPWELYERKIITAPAAMIFGTVGTRKSTLAKCWAMRLVLTGRKLSVTSDVKGEWTPVIEALGGQVIKLGPGLNTRVNPLDEGVRPSLSEDGEVMTEEKWAEMVRSRRLTLMNRIVRILEERKLTHAEIDVIRQALDDAVDAEPVSAQGTPRTVIIPDIIDKLWGIYHAEQTSNPTRSEAANGMAMTLRRLTTGDMKGMVDGESTHVYDPFATAVSLDTSALGEADQVLRNVISACSTTWTEAMIGFAEAGQRVVVNEEAWTEITSEDDLAAKVRFFKLARTYGIFNILILHKLTDLDIAGDAGSKEAAMARGLLAEADIKIIHKQDASALTRTMSELEISERERTLLKDLEPGVALWRIGSKMGFQVATRRTAAEVPLTDTDQRMNFAAGTDGADEPETPATGAETRQHDEDEAVVDAEMAAAGRGAETAAGQEDAA